MLLLAPDSRRMRLIREDCTIERGGQNLPGGNWETGGFNLAGTLPALGRSVPRRLGVCPSIPGSWHSQQALEFVRPVASVGEVSCRCALARQDETSLAVRAEFWAHQPCEEHGSPCPISGTGRSEPHAGETG